MSLSKELGRLATYTSWPPNSCKSPIVLARLGFYSIGEGDEVECFQCKTRLRRFLETVDPQAMHRQMAPNCQLLRVNQEINVPLETSLTIPYREDVAFRSSEASENTLGLQSDEPISEPERIYHQALYRARKSEMFPNVNCSFINRTKPDFVDLRSEEKRLLTFHDWPQTAFVSPDDLAREGLFYTGTGDKVQCAYCRGYISAWEPTDIPREEHKKHFPTCPLVLGRAAARNKVVNEDRIAVTACQGLVGEASTPEQILTWIGRKIEAEMGTPIVGKVLDMGFPSDKVKAVIETRLQVTGRNNGVAILGHAFQNEESLIEAILQLRDSTETSAAAMPGAMASAMAPETAIKSNCSTSCLGSVSTSSSSSASLDFGVSNESRYSAANNRQTGEKHRQDFQNSQLVLDRGYRTVNEDKLDNRVGASEQISLTAGRYIHPSMIDARMDTPRVRILLDRGYNPDIVRSVIATRLSTTGDDFPDVESLLNAVLELQEPIIEEPPETTTSALTHEADNNSKDEENSSISEETV